MPPDDSSPDRSRPATSSRWKRRRSDGASFETEAESFRENETWAPSTCAPRRRILPRAIQLPSWSANREPIRLTAEFRRRIAAASRAAAASLLVFSVLVATKQSVFPVMWIGNVLTLSTLKPTLGDTAIATKHVAVPLFPVAAISWGISLLLDASDTLTYSLLLPPIVMIGSLVVILCPWPFLTSKNLMLVVFYLIVASPLASRYGGNSEGKAPILVQEPLGPWFAPSFVGTCCVGLSVSLAGHLFLACTPRSTMASRMVPTILNRLGEETHQLLMSVGGFLDNIGRASSSARRARGRINLFVSLRGRTLSELKAYSSAAQAEMRMSCILSRESGRAFTQGIDEYIACAEKQQAHAELVRLATTQQLLGEDFTIRSEAVRDVKTKMSDHLGSAVENLASAYDEAQKSYVEGDDQRQDAFSALQRGLAEYRAAMKRAITEAEVVLLNGNIDTHSASTTGPLIRARVIFHSVFSFAIELSDLLSLEISEDEIEESKYPSLWSRTKSSIALPWFWNDLVKRRVAVKTAVSIGLASLWVSVPQLREHIAHPNSIWPGVTVASVNLETTGAAYQKCIDRLWGTLVAAAYALLVGKLFAPANHAAKILAIGLFTFAAIFLQNPRRPYACQYAASSVGSILFGSIEMNVDVEGYIPNRIMLIFIGVIIFLVVELLVFPRSSRTIVQAKSIQFFEDTEQYLVEARKVAESISLQQHSDQHNNAATAAADDLDTRLMNDPLWMLRRGQKEMAEHTQGLNEAASVVESTLSEAKSELEPGLSEPSLGLNVQLDSNGYRTLLEEQRRCLAQFEVLTTSIQSLLGYYSCLGKDSPVRSLHWPLILTTILAKVANQLTICCDGLREVFPHGLCRPGSSDTISIIESIASFRNFEDVRLMALSEWAERHREYLDRIKSTGTAVQFAPGFRLSLALAMSSALEISRCLQSCGECLESIVQSFPVE